MAYQQLMPEVLQVLENYSFEHDYGVSGYSLKLLLPALFDKRSPAYGLIKPRSLGKLLSAIMIDTGSADVTRTSSKEWKIAYSVPLVLRENSAIKEFLQNWVTQRLDQILDGGYELDQDQLSKIQSMAEMAHGAVSDPSFYICDGYTPRYVLVMVMQFVTNCYWNLPMVKIRLHQFTMLIIFPRWKYFR